MRIHITAVGRLKAGPERELVDAYIGRAGALGRRAGITAFREEEVAESRAAVASRRTGEEAARLLQALPEQAVIVALDSEGRNLSSEEFAAAIARWRDASAADLAFLIGGPEGHGPAVQARASLLLSFGRMTWPHRLARIMLAEQIYRAVTILLNHPYHRA